MQKRHLTSGDMSITHSNAGILLWSIALIQEGRDVAAAFLFALLLNMKHLFAALAPLYFVYLLRHHCRSACHPQLRQLLACNFLMLLISLETGSLFRKNKLKQAAKIPTIPHCSLASR